MERDLTPVRLESPQVGALGAHRKRVYRLRPPEEHVEHRLPELAIESDELWARVQARVRQITEAFATVGASDALVVQLRKEETALHALRAQLSAAVASAKPRDPAGVMVSPEKLAKYLRHVEKLAEESPSKARDALFRVLTPVVLHPVERNGKRAYEGHGAPKIEGPVSLEGDRASDKVGCGGKPWSKADLLPFAPSLRPARAP